MNLVEVATWIQEGYKKYYEDKKAGRTIDFRLPSGKPVSSVKECVMYYVMKKGEGHLNPKEISMLIDMETSVPDEHGTVQL